MRYLKTYEGLLYNEKEEIMDNLTDKEKKIISKFIEQCYNNKYIEQLKIIQISTIASKFTVFFLMNKNREYIDYKRMSKCYDIKGNNNYISDFMHFIKLKYNIDEHDDFFNYEEIIIFIGEYIRYISEKNNINYEKFYGLL
jgi:hypothetical protein